MGRARDSKFSFPIPGRRSQKTKENTAGLSAAQPAPQQWATRLEEPTSKAHRVLGTSESPITHAQSRQSSITPNSPVYRNMTASFNGSYQDQHDVRTSAITAEYAKRPAMSKRPSSNILGNTSGSSTRRGSDNSSTSYRLQQQNSSSTMRSHYDAKTSPLSVSQQTSNSAVRDLALRRGKPQVVADHYTHIASGHEASPVSPLVESEGRKNKPARLDLSKLFPIPRASDTWNHSNALLSPAKMVNSPAAMSMNSEYYGQPMTREPTPVSKGRAKLTKHATRRHAEHAPPALESPKRLFQRDQYDNAKVNVRRPPKGVQHWFDAFDDDSDDMPDDNIAPAHAPQAFRSSHTPKVPLRKTSLNGLHTGNASSHPAPRAQKSVPGFSSHDSFSHEDMIDIKGLTYPSQISLHTQNSAKTKESTLSKHNLQDSSCLSFSSSEDEHDDDARALREFAVRKSLIMDDDAGDIVFGQAQAFEVRSKRSLERKMSIMSTSTNAATIDIVYTPEPFSPPTFARVSNCGSSRRSSHLRQPSIILEDENDRPHTARYAPPSSSAYSIRSMRTSASEPQPRSLDAQRKMMSVTPEEEALLEMMRKKRASMAKQSTSSTTKVYPEHENQRQKALDALQKTSQSSAFPAVDSPVASPIRVVEMKSNRKSLAASSTTSSTHLTPPPRGRSAKTNHDANMTSSFRDSSASEEGFTFPVARGSLPHQLPPPGIFSPLDPFPPMSPYHGASIASPTTIDHISPLPSPVTPGHRADKARDNVRIASSDTSADGEEMPVLDTELPIHIIQAAKSLETMESSHQRRRTASSGADMAFPIPPSYGAKDLAPLSEASVSSRAPSIIEPAMPLPAAAERNSMRKSAMVLAFEQRSRKGSNASSHSNTSSLNASVYLGGRDRSRHASRGSSVASTSRSKARSSVSEDVLAAWGSLGGTY
jgi:hypothetical protein